MTRVISDGNIREWPEEFKEDFLQAIVSDTDVPVERIVRSSNTSLDIEFDVEDFITNGLEELENLKERKIYDILDRVGSEGKEALSMLRGKKVKTEAFKKYKDYTLGDIIDDDFKRNQLIGYSTFSYEGTEDDDGNVTWKPKTILRDTLDEENFQQRGEALKGIPDLDHESIPLPSEIWTERMAPTEISQTRMEDAQSKHLLKYYDNIKIVRKEGPTKDAQKAVSIVHPENDKEKDLKDKLRRFIAGNINPSIIGPIAINLYTLEEEDDRLKIQMEISQEEEGRYEIRPFGGISGRTGIRRITQTEFEEYIEENKAEIQIGEYSKGSGEEKITYDKGEALDSIEDRTLDVIVQAGSGIKTMEDALNEIDPIDVVKFLAAIYTVKAIRKDLVESRSRIDTEPEFIGNYQVNIKMDSILQDIEERYVELEDDIENAKDFIGGYN